jgi:hypothetical protein
MNVAGGIAFDHANNLWYADQSGQFQGSMNLCHRLINCAGAPGFSGLRNPVLINFDRGFQSLYVADPGTSQILRYSPGGTLLGSITFNPSVPPVGVAAFPPP